MTPDLSFCRFRFLACMEAGADGDPDGLGRKQMMARVVSVPQVFPPPLARSSYLASDTSRLRSQTPALQASASVALSRDIRTVQAAERRLAQSSWPDSLPGLTRSPVAGRLRQRYPGPLPCKQSHAPALAPTWVRKLSAAIRTALCIASH